jgi:Lamin Tail Domain
MTRTTNTARGANGQRVLTFALLTTSFVLAAACNSETLLSPNPVLTTIDVTLESSSIEVGQFSVATAVGLDQFAAPVVTGQATYTSSAPDVAMISPTTGNMLAIAPGTTVITATIDGRSGQRTITVVNAPPIKVNEVESNGDALGGWVELFNPRTTAVDLSGWTLTSDDVSRVAVLRAGTIIPGGGYLVIDETLLPSGLRSADGVHLFSHYGVLVDGYAWTAKPATTYGRCADGRGNFVTTDGATRGAPNACRGLSAR